MMEYCTALGVFIIVFGVVLLLDSLFHVIMDEYDDMDVASLLFCMFVAIVITIFVISPETYGYTKIVSGNEVEMVGGEQNEGDN